jgi:hypothetical protein
VIIDDAAAQAFTDAGCNIEAAMAASFARNVDKFDDRTQNRMSRLDLWLLRQPDVRESAMEWRGKFIAILDDFADGELLKPEAGEREEF